MAHRVGYEVGDRARELRPVGPNHAWVLGNMHRKLHPCRLDVVIRHGRLGKQQLREVNALARELKARTLELHKVEEHRHEARHLIGLRAYGVQVAGAVLLVAHNSVVERLRKARNRHDRRTQVVGHVRDHEVSSLVGPAELLVARAELGGNKVAGLPRKALCHKHHRSCRQQKHKDPERDGSRARQQAHPIGAAAEQTPPHQLRCPAKGLDQPLRAARELLLQHHCQKRRKDVALQQAHKRFDRHERNDPQREVPSQL